VLFALGKFVGFNVCSCNHVLVHYVFLLVAIQKSVATPHQIVAKGYYTVPIATICRPKNIDAIDSSCNQNDHIATKYRRWPRHHS
jgi:hypothetical protein